MAAARAEVTAVRLFQRAGTPSPVPGAIPDPSTRYVMVEYRFIDSGVQSMIPFDDWELAPTVGDLIDISAAVVPALERRLGE